MQAPADNLDSPAPLRLRDAETVMNLNRLGCLYQYRLSFMRILIRRLVRERWKIERRVFDLDSDGFGTAIYEIQTPQDLFSFVVFAHYLDPAERSDRVIADKWDMTVTLCLGRVDAERLENLRDNVPLQEAGRLDPSCIVLSRANKSARNFEYVVNCLANGDQPDLKEIARVGYLYRTTAVYGSGKFGMADWQKVSQRCPDFAQPFAAEMFCCYLIRQFSLEQANFLAACRNPAKAVALGPGISRYIGIGNATGLGMAPYLINHPLLISRWIEVRETALARAMHDGPFTEELLDRFVQLADRAIRHLNQIATDNQPQNLINETAAAELEDFRGRLQEHASDFHSWIDVATVAARDYGYETQELVNSLIIELHANLVDRLEDQLLLEERYDLSPEMPVTELKNLIEERYQWALNFDHEQPGSTAVFWYRSEEKMEPRLGIRNKEPGHEREMAIDVARAVSNCYADVRKFSMSASGNLVADFCLRFPIHRRIIRRIQTMAKTRYGDIQANLLDADVLPIHLLRCKLSFFGVGKFDPKSRLWVRNTMFQGAPVRTELQADFDDWCFPVVSAN